MKKTIMLSVAALLFYGCSLLEKKTIVVTVQDDIAIATMEAKKITLITKDNIQYNGSAYAPDMEKIYIFINQKCIQGVCEKVYLVTSKKADVVTKSVNPINNSIQDNEQYKQLLDEIQPKLILEKNSILNLHKENF